MGYIKCISGAVGEADATRSHPNTYGSVIFQFNRFPLTGGLIKQGNKGHGAAQNPSKIASTLLQTVFPWPLFLGDLS